MTRVWPRRYGVYTFRSTLVHFQGVSLPPPPKLKESFCAVFRNEVGHPVREKFFVCGHKTVTVSGVWKQIKLSF